MFYTIFLICLLINIGYTNNNNNRCSDVNSKLDKYGIELTVNEKDFAGLLLCQNFINNYCCPQNYEYQIQNATKTELRQLFEFYSINLYELLQQITIQLNETIQRLIEKSRNETHFIFQKNHEKIYTFYRTSIDLFFDNLLKTNYKNYQYEIKNNVEEFFRNILRMTITINNDNKPILPSFLLCLWSNHPFGNRQYLIVNQLEIHLGKLLHLTELYKLSNELVQTISMDIITDTHCIDSYMQLSYCNLCSGRNELPCLSNCINVIESCLINISLIHDLWTNFIDSIENHAYFNGIENVLSSISVSISDAFMALFNSDGIQNKDIVNECGYMHIKKDIFGNDRIIHKYYNSNKILLLDEQLDSMRQSLQSYKSFWLILPEQICKYNDLSVSNKKLCWTGTSISYDDKRDVQINYDKPLSLRLQRILKAMKEKSQIIANKKRLTTGVILSTTTENLSGNDELKLNLTIDFDDYPDDNELDYSDYGYEDLIDDSNTITATATTSSSSSTTFSSSSIPIDDDGSIDDTNSPSYYDYGEQDLYSYDEIDEISSQKLSSVSTTLSTTTTTTTTTQSTTTTNLQKPSYHHRRPIIWNLHIDEDSSPKTQPQYNSSFSNNYSLFLLLLMFILY